MGLKATPENIVEFIGDLTLHQYYSLVVILLMQGRDLSEGAIDEIDELLEPDVSLRSIAEKSNESKH